MKKNRVVDPLNALMIAVFETTRALLFRSRSLPPLDDEIVGLFGMKAGSSSPSAVGAGGGPPLG